MVFLVCVVCDVDLFVVEVDVVEAKLVEFDFLILIASFAHHSERVIIVTHGKFQSLAITKFRDKIISNKLNNHIIFLIFIPNSQK